MKYGFLTSYIVNDKEYSSYVVAETIDEAKLLTQKRGLCETILSQKMPLENSILTPKQVDENGLAEMLHPVCFLTFLASKAGVTDLDNAIGDEGILHEMIHELNSKDTKKISALKQRIKALIKSVPGAF